MTKPLPIANFPLRAETLSDLFFNFEHPERAQLYNRPEGEDVSAEEEHLANKADALNFIGCFAGEGLTLGEKLELIKWLVDDFEGRL